MQFMQYFIWGSWFVSIGSYLRKTLSFTGGEIGWIYSTPGIAAMVMPFVMGIIADKYLPLQKLLSVLHLIGGVLLIWSSAFTSFSSFFPSILIYSLTYQPTFALTSSLCFHHLSDPSSNYPKVRVFGTIGWIVGGVLVSILGWETLKYQLWISASASFIQAIYCLTLPNTPPSQSKTQIADFKAFVSNKSILFIMATMLLITIPASFYYSFLNVFMADQAYTTPAAKMSIGQITEILVMLSTPFFIKKFGWFRVIAIGMLIWAFRYYLLSFAGPANENIVWVAILVHGFAYCFTGLTSQLLVNEVAPDGIRATAQGIFSFVVMGLGTLIGSVIAGMVVDFYSNGTEIGWKQVWFWVANFALMTSFIHILLSPRFKLVKKEL